MDPTASDAEFPADAIEVARILDAWGIKGWVRVQPLSSDPQALFSSRRWFLRPGDQAAARRPAGGVLPTLLRITQVRGHGGEVLAAARGVDDRSAAEALRGARIFVSRASFPSLGEDEFYWVDLIGLSVVNRSGAVLGEVSGLLDTGVHSVLRVQPRAAPQAAASAEILIPFVAAYVDRVDRGERRIDVDWGADY